MSGKRFSKLEFKIFELLLFLLFLCGQIDFSLSILMCSEQHTDLANYIGWKVAELNGNKLKGKAGFVKIMSSLAVGEDVVFTLANENTTVAKFEKKASKLD